MGGEVYWQSTVGLDGDIGIREQNVQFVKSCVLLPKYLDFGLSNPTFVINPLLIERAILLLS
jgi:hypothetical protein